MEMKGKTYKIDASGKVLGRLAAEIAVLLRGKGNPSFLRYVDGGNSVEVENAKDIKFIGKKLQQKKYFRHSGYPGGLKTQKLEDKFKNDPTSVLRQAVYGMLPKNKTRARIIKRLKIYKGDKSE